MHFEIKSSQTYNKNFIKNIEKSYVIYAGDLMPEIHSTLFINYKDTNTIR